MSITVLSGHAKAIPLKFKNAAGNPAVTPPTGGSVATDNAAIVTAGLGVDQQTVTLTAGPTIGSTNINYFGPGGMKATVVVTTTNTDAVSVEFDETAVVDVA